MKKILSIIITFVFVLGAYSCGGVEIAVTDTTATSEVTTAEQSALFKPYKFGTTPGDYMFESDTRGVIMKYNVHNGQSSYLCPDPFCNHTKSTCQFNGLGSLNYTSIGNTVYYVKQDAETGKSALYAFDADTSETNTVLTRDGMMTAVYAYEKRLLILWLEKYDFEAERYYFWYDIKTGETEKLGDEVNVMKPYETRLLNSVRDDRIIWSVRTQDGTSYQSTNLHGEDLKEHDFGYKYGHYYETVPEKDENGEITYSMYVTLQGENERKCILEKVGPILVYENKIVYAESIPYEKQKIVHVDRDGKEDRDDWGGNVYVMNPDGSDKHLLLHTNEFLVGTSSDSAHPLVCGDYIGILIGKYQGDALVTDRILIANLNTGEFVVTHK